MQSKHLKSANTSESTSIQTLMDSLEAQQQSDQFQTAQSLNGKNADPTHRDLAIYDHLLQELRLCLETKSMVWSNLLATGFRHWITDVLLGAIQRQNKALQSEVDVAISASRSISGENPLHDRTQVRYFYCQLQHRIAEPLQDIGLIDSALFDQSAQVVIH